jgi:hypothetical protein
MHVPGGLFTAESHDVWFPNLWTESLMTISSTKPRTRTSVRCLSTFRLLIGLQKPATSYDVPIYKPSQISFVALIQTVVAIIPTHSFLTMTAGVLNHIVSALFFAGFVLVMIPFPAHWKSMFAQGPILESLADQRITHRVEYRDVSLYGLDSRWMPQSVYQLRGMEQKHGQQGACMV